MSFSRVYDFETVVLRYFNVFGPRQSPFSQYAAVVPLFLTRDRAGEPVTIFGDGEQSRDFTYVDNVVDATISAPPRPRARTAGSSTSRPGRPRRSTSSRTTIARLLGKQLEKAYLPPRSGDLRNSWADPRDAREVLGWEPHVGLEEGLRRTAESLGAA